MPGTITILGDIFILLGVAETNPEKFEHSRKALQDAVIEEVGIPWEDIEKLEETFVLRSSKTLSALSDLEKQMEMAGEIAVVR